MKYTHKIVAGSLLSILTVSSISPIKMVSASSKVTEVDLIAQRGRAVGRFIKEAGKWVFLTTAGVIVEESVSEAASRTFKNVESRSRLEELAALIHQEQYTHYIQYGRPIVVNNQNVNTLMFRVGASPSEQNFVVSRMNLYWGY